MIDALVSNHRRFLSFLERRTGNRADAEDILQSAFVRGLEKGAALRDSESAVAWFYRLLRNALVDYYRRADAEQQAVGAAGREAEYDASGNDDDLWSEACRCVLALLPALAPEEAKLLRRVDLEDMAVVEAARQFGITANNASVRLHRARRALLAQVQRSCGACATHGCMDCSCGGRG